MFGSLQYRKRKATAKVMNGYEKHSFTLLKVTYAMLPFTLVIWPGGGCTVVSRADTVPTSCNLKFFSYKLLSKELLQNTFETMGNHCLRLFTCSNKNRHGDINMRFERRPTFIFIRAEHVKS